MKEIKTISKVLYQGVKLDTHDVKALLRDLGYSEEIVAAVKSEIHMTTRFAPRPQDMYGSNILGTRVGLRVLTVGELWEDGVLKNLGLKVAYDGPCASKIPHITCAIFNGGKAKDTWKCDFARTIEDVVLAGQYAVFDAQNNWAYAVASPAQ